MAMVVFSPKRNLFGRGSLCGTASKSQRGNCETRRDPGPLRPGARNVARRDLADVSASDRHTSTVCFSAEKKFVWPLFRFRRGKYPRKNQDESFDRPDLFCSGN